MDELSSEITPAIKPKKRKVWLWVVLITLVVAILGFCICVFVKEGNLNWTSIKSVFQKEETKKDDTAKETATVATDPTADWIDYTNNTYGISFKYPADWALNSGSNTGFGTQAVTLQDPETVKAHPNAMDPIDDIAIVYYPTVAAGRAGKSITTLTDYAQKVCTKDSSPVEQTFAGEKSFYCLGPGVNEVLYYFVVKNNHLYEIIFTQHTAKDQLTVKENQILSTFQFTASSAAATNWKTYTNDTYGFQLTLNDLWENYTTCVKDGDENAYKYIYFLLPTTDKMTGDNSLTAYGKAGYASPFVISVYTPSGWAQELIDLEARGIPADPILTTDKYIFSWSQGQSCPPDQCNKNLDVAGIIKTIKLN